MIDRIPTKILENGAIRYAEYDGTGNFVQYRYLLPADEPTQVGTPLNKGTLLGDTTAALYGLGSGAVPNDALAWIGKYNQYWWSRIPNQALYEYLEVRTTITSSTSLYYGSLPAIYYSKAISINQSTGEVSLVSPNSVGPGLPDAIQTVCSQAPIYFRVGSNSTIYYFPTGSTYGVGYLNTVSTDDEPYSAAMNSGATVRGQTVTSVVHNIPPGATQYLYSSNRNAYPDDGVSGGYRYLYLGNPFDNAIKASKIAVGSYLGTGTAGSANPVVLTTNFMPRFAIVIQSNLAETVFGIFIKPSQSVPVCLVGNSTPTALVTASWGNTTLSWYNASLSNYQLNSSGRTYNWIIGG